MSQRILFLSCSYASPIDEVFFQKVTLQCISIAFHPRAHSILLFFQPKGCRASCGMNQGIFSWLLYRARYKCWGKSDWKSKTFPNNCLRWGLNSRPLVYKTSASTAELQRPRLRTMRPLLYRICSSWHVASRHFLSENEPLMRSYIPRRPNVIMNKHDSINSFKLQ